MPHDTTGAVELWIDGSQVLNVTRADTLDGSALKANLADGILKVTIPLHESAQPRKVEIK